MSKNKNKFIVTSEGFIKDIQFNRESLTIEILYTKKLHEAKQFSNKQAEAAMVKHNILGFIYSPWLEEPVEISWIVTKGTEFCVLPHSISIDYWVARKVPVKKSDANFLNNNPWKTPLYSKEEAERIANERNKDYKEFYEKLIKTT